MRRWSDLLDRGEEPAAAAAADEGPDLGRLDRAARIALDDLGVVAAHGVVARAPAQPRGHVLEAVLGPGLLDVALEELDVLDLVLDAAAGVRRELLVEVGHHLGRHEA